MHCGHRPGLSLRIGARLAQRHRSEEADSTGGLACLEQPDTQGAHVAGFLAILPL